MIARVPSTWFLTALLVAGVLACCSPCTWAQEATEAEDASTLREQSIYIPYAELREVFEREGRGVFLPYDKFRELWEAAQKATEPVERAESPRGAVITDVFSEATVAENTVEVVATVKIELLKPGWHEVPLRLSDVAITEATLEGEPARILSTDNGYTLLVEKPDVPDAPATQRVELSLKYAARILREPGRNRVRFHPPQGPVNRWRVRIPEPGVKVDVYPMLAATEIPTESEAVADEEPATDDPAEPQETIVLAFVGAAPEVRIEWAPKAEGATGLEALASVRSEQQVSLDEGVVRTRTSLTYTISRAEMATLAIEVPADEKVVNVFDDNVRQWSVDAAEDVQTIQVQLFEPATGEQRVVVELEKFAESLQDDAAEPKDAAAQVEVTVPVVRSLGVGRQHGVVVVRVGGGLRAEAVRSTRLLQVDRDKLPGALAGGQWDFSYRHASVPYELTLAVEKIEPQVVVDTLLDVTLQPERLSVALLSVFDIERAGIFQLELEIPKGFEIRQVTGQKIGPAEPVAVESYHTEGEDPVRLIVNLRRKALGKVALRVRLEQELDEPALASPTDEKAEIPLTLPSVVPASVAWSAGRVVLAAPESLRVTTGQPELLRRIGLAEAVANMMLPDRSTTMADVRPVDAFAFTETPGELAITAERRKPHVAVRQLLVAEVEDGAVHYKATFFFDVRYSGVKTLRVDLPTETAPDVRNDTSGVQDAEMVPPPDDLAEGYVAWQFTRDSEFLGEQAIELVWDEPIDEQLERGNHIELPVRRLIGRGTEPEWGQIVLTKSETIDLRVTDPEGLRGIDPRQDLMPGADVPEAAVALEFHGDWSLSATATRYDIEEIKHAAVERALLRMVVTRANQVSVQALYRMQSARQRVVVTLPQDARFDSEPRVNGRPVALEVGLDREYHVPLARADSEDDRFLLEFRYTQPGNGKELVLPEFPQEPAMQQVYLAVYLPEERVLTGTGGPWTDAFGWREGRSLFWIPDPDRSDSELVEWVAQGQSTESFATDGTMYLFTALRPESTAVLRLSTIDRTTLSLIVLVLLGILGVALLPTRMSTRIVVLGGVVILLVVISVWSSVFAYQILNGVFALGVLVMAVVWAVWFAVRTLPGWWRTFQSCRERPAEVSKVIAPIEVPEPPAETSGDVEGGETHE